MFHPLQHKLADYQVILASGSPRRKELLKGLDIDFNIEKPDFDEQFPNNLKAEKITEYIVAQKAKHYNKLLDNKLIILADTIVWFEDKPLMKPKNFTEAVQLINDLSGNTHEVFTSVCIKTQQKEVIFTERTEVTFSLLYPTEIMYYVEKYKPFDKAGAYGIQEWIGYVGIEKINGCYYNIMGLPLHQLYKELQNLV